MQRVIAVAVDHADDSQVAGLFARIRREQRGRLDVLVNNTTEEQRDSSAAEATPYWDHLGVRSPGEEWDMINRVGLRNSFTCCVLATRMMLECRRHRRRQHEQDRNGIDIVNRGDENAPLNLSTGVIVNISSMGGTMRLFNVPFCAGQ